MGLYDGLRVRPGSGGARAQPDFGVQAPQPLTPVDEWELTKGLRRGTQGVFSNMRGFGAALQEPFDPEAAAENYRIARENMAQVVRDNPLAVENLTDIKSAGDILPWMGGAAGQGLPTTVAALGAGLGARVGMGALRGVAGLVGRKGLQSALSNNMLNTGIGMGAGMLPMEGGEQAMTIQNDPVAMANSTPWSRLGNVLGKGAVNTVAEEVTPMFLLGKFGKEAVKGVGRGWGNAAKAMGTAALEGTLGEAGTEGLQNVSGDVFTGMLNPAHEVDWKAALNAAAAGGIVGTGMGGVAGAGQATLANLPGASRGVEDRTAGDVLADATIGLQRKAGELSEKLKETGQKKADKMGFDEMTSHPDFDTMLKGAQDTSSPDWAQKDAENTQIVDRFVNTLTRGSHPTNIAIDGGMLQGLTDIAKGDFHDAVVAYKMGQAQAGGDAAALFANKAAFLDKLEQLREGKKFSTLATRIAPETKSSGEAVRGTPESKLADLQDFDTQYPEEVQLKAMSYVAGKFPRIFKPSLMPSHDMNTNELKLALVKFARAGFSLGSNDNELPSIFQDAFGNQAAAIIRATASDLYDQGMISEEAANAGGDLATVIGSKVKFDNAFATGLKEKLTGTFRDHFADVSAQGVMKELVARERAVRADPKKEAALKADLSGWFGKNAPEVRAQLAQYEEQMLGKDVTAQGAESRVALSDEDIADDAEAAAEGDIGQITDWRRPSIDPTKVTWSRQYNTNYEGEQKELAAQKDVFTSLGSAVRNVGAIDYLREQHEGEPEALREAIVAFIKQHEKSIPQEDRASPHTYLNKTYRMLRAEDATGKSEALDVPGEEFDSLNPKGDNTKNVWAVSSGRNNEFAGAEHGSVWFERAEHPAVEAQPERVDTATGEIVPAVKGRKVEAAKLFMTRASKIIGRMYASTKGEPSEGDKDSVQKQHDLLLRGISSLLDSRMADGSYALTGRVGVMENGQMRWLTQSRPGRDDVNDVSGYKSRVERAASEGEVYREVSARRAASKEAKQLVLPLNFKLPNGTVQDALKITTPAKRAVRQKYVKRDEETGKEAIKRGTDAFDKALLPEMTLLELREEYAANEALIVSAKERVASAKSINDKLKQKGILAAYEARKEMILAEADTRASEEDTGAQAKATSGSFEKTAYVTSRVPGKKLGTALPPSRTQITPSEVAYEDEKGRTLRGETRRTDPFKASEERGKTAFEETAEMAENEARKEKTKVREFDETTGEPLHPTPSKVELAPTDAALETRAQEAKQVNMLVTKLREGVLPFLTALRKSTQERQDMMLGLLKRLSEADAENPVWRGVELAKREMDKFKKAARVVLEKMKTPETATVQETKAEKLVAGLPEVTEGKPGSKGQPHTVPMYYVASNEALRSDLRSKYPNGVKLTRLITDGFRTGTTRSPQSGVLPGHYIKFPGAEGVYRVTGFEKIDLKTLEGRNKWSSREGWDADAAMQLYPTQVRDGAIQMLFERVQEVKAESLKGVNAVKDIEAALSDFSVRIFPGHSVGDTVSINAWNDLCVHTSERLANHLQKLVPSGFTVKRSSVMTKNPAVAGTQINHYRVVVSKDGESFVVDQPQNELVSRADSKHFRINSTTWTPRILTVAELDTSVVDTPALASIKRTIDELKTQIADSHMLPLPKKGAMAQLDRALKMDSEDATYEYEIVLDRVKHYLKTKAEQKKESAEVSGAERASQAEIDEAVAEHARVMGPIVKGVFVQEGLIEKGKHISGQWQNNLIKISMFAKSPIGTLRHEHVHQLFKWLSENGSTATIEALKNAGTNTILLGKLRMLFKDDAQATKQLSNPEEAAAYLYQFWNARNEDGSRMIELGPKTETVFRKVLRIISKLFGIATKHMNESRNAELIFEALSKGEFAGKNDAAMNIIEKKLAGSKLLREQRSAYDKGFTDNPWLKNLLFRSFTVLRDSGSKYLKETGDLFYKPFGERMKAGEQDHFSAVKQMANKYGHEVNRLYMGLTQGDKELQKQELELAVTYLNGRTSLNEIVHPQVKQFVRGARKLFQDMHAYARHAGVSVLDEKGAWKLIGEIQDYYPRQFDPSYLQGHLKEFTDKLIKHHADELDGLAQVAEQERLTQTFTGKYAASNTVPAGTPITREHIAQAIAAQILNSGGDTGGESISGIGITPYASAVNHRTLLWLDDEAFAEFMSKDVLSTMLNYVHQMVKRAEHTRRFGHGGEKIHKNFDRAYVEHLLGPEVVKELETELEGQNKSLTDKYGYSATVMAHHIAAHSTMLQKSTAELKADYASRAMRETAVEHRLTRARIDLAKTAGLEKIKMQEQIDNLLFQQDMMQIEQADVTEEMARRDKDGDKSRIDAKYHDLRSLANTRLKGTPDEIQAKIKKTNDFLADPMRVIMAMEGTLGRDIDAHLRSILQGAKTYQSIRLLPLTLFTSFTDPGGLIVRGAKVVQGFEAFVRGLKDVARIWVGKPPSMDVAAAIGAHVGLLEAGSHLSAVSELNGSVYEGSPIIRKINDTFFRWNGMEAWNRAMRIMGGQFAMDFIKRHMQNPGVHSRRLLEDIGIDPDKDYFLKEDMYDPHNPNQLWLKAGELDINNPVIQHAIMRWVDGAILNPNAAQRPIVASDPHYDVFYQFKMFTYTFHSAVIDRAMSEAEHGNLTPFISMMAVYAPVIVAADLIRVMLTSGDEPVWARSIGGVIEHAIVRANYGGIPQMVVGDLPIVGKGHPARSLGPTIDQVIGLAMATFTGEGSVTSELLGALPAGNVARGLGPKVPAPDNIDMGVAADVFGEAAVTAPALARIALRGK